jgi:hypothetical protein
MKIGDINLICTVAESSRVLEGFKFKKKNNLPTKLYERNVVMILALSLFLMIAHDVYLVVR